MDKIALVTGGMGFVGRQICKHLAALGYRLRLIVRHKPLIDQPNVERVIHTSDLFEESVDWFVDALKGVDTIVHSAWHVDPRTYLQSENNLNCLYGTLRLAQGAIRSNVRRFVGIGTCFEYDLSQGRLSVDTPLRPTSLYGSAKAASFILLSQLFAPSTIEFLWCRLFYLYGEGEKPTRLVPYVRQQLSAGHIAELTSGAQVRDFMDVSEAGAIVARLTAETRCGPINVCSGIPRTVREMVEDIADTYGRRDLLDFGKRSDNLVDPPFIVGVKNY